MAGQEGLGDMPTNNNWYLYDETQAALDALARGPSVADQMRSSYLKAIDELTRTASKSRWGGGWYRSTNPALAGRDMSGLTGQPLYASMEEQQAAKMALSPISFAPAAPAAPVAPVSQTTTFTTQAPVMAAASNLASASKPFVPQFIQPYGKPTGPGAYGEKDINY